MTYFGKLKSPQGDIHIIKEQCKGCGFCVEYCPQDVLEISEEFNKKGYHPPRIKNEQNCIACRLCEMMCPEFAIFVTIKEEKNQKEVNNFESRP